MAAFFLLAAAASTASGAVTCDECKTGTTDLVDRLTSPSSIAEQIAILTAVVCPQLSPDMNCEELLNTWWGDAATCMYTHIADSSPTPCVQLGYCASRRALTQQARDWTCEECTSILVKVSDLLQDQDIIDDSIGHLQGECFCGAGGHTDDCPDILSSLMISRHRLRSSSVFYLRDILLIHNVEIIPI